MKKKKLIFTIIAIVSVLLMITAIVMDNKASIALALIGATALFVLAILKWLVPAKKNVLFKIVTLMGLYLLVVSWIIPAASASGTELVNMQRYRMSLYSILEYPYLSFQYFLQPLLFILAVGGLYGILTGDEGWKYVNNDLAVKRISNSWGSRKFVKFIAFGVNFLLLNLNNSITEKEYEKQQKGFSSKYYGDMNEYFKLKSKFAGVNHGILFAVETVMAIKTVTKYILDRQSSSKKYEDERFSVAMKRTKAYRRDLMITLNKVEQIDISELGELEDLVLRTQNINPVIEKIKYLLELLDADLSLMYSQQTNKLVNFLTVFGIMISSVGSIASLLSLIISLN